MTRKASRCLGNRFLIVFSLFVFSFAPHSAAQPPDPAFPVNLPSGHIGAVTALLRDGYGNIFSAGEDGFVGLWSAQTARERHQISRYSIRSFVLRPGRPQFAFIERGGIDRYRVSVWDYETRENLFTLRFRDPISFISYSAAGGFLILARGGARAGAIFIHPETGQTLESAAEVAGPITFAATGHNERVMISYLSSGFLSYWDLYTGNELYRFELPPDIRSPVLFGSNRFLGGFDSRGLLVIDAATGDLLTRNPSISQGIIFAGNSDTADSRGFVQFYTLSSAGGSYAVYHMEINLDGRLATLNRRTVPSAGTVTSAIVGEGDTIVMGTSEGVLWLLSGTMERVMATGNTQRVLSIAASPSTIAFICETGAVGYIPLDFSLLSDGGILTMDDAGGHTRVVSDTSASARSDPIDTADTAAFPPACRFLFWQPGAARSVPVVKTLASSPKEAVTSRLILDQIPSRFPPRSVDVMGNSALFLDTVGALSVLDIESAFTRFSHSVPGSLDAAFINDDTIIFARSVAAGNTPFLMVNISTGETVPLAYPAIVGTRVYRGSSGAIYGAVVNHTAEGLETSIIRLDTSAPARSRRLIEYNGEDSDFTMAESGGNFASTLGRTEALLYRGRTNAVLERSGGFPAQIVNGGPHWFVSLDGDGGITWHDNLTGRLLAVFRLKTNGWTLERQGGSISGQRY